jgi:type VI secretion system protein ImpH
LHYTEWLIRRRYEYRDTTAAAFLDLFLHRLVSLFYRAWEKHSLPVQYENAQFRGKSASELGLMDCLFDLVGAGTPGLREQLSEIEEQALIYYGGLIAQQPHSTIALESLLADFFQVPVSVEQFRGKWLPLDANEFSDMRGDEAQNTLGEGASLGDAVWHPQARIRVHIGPVTQTRFRALLPSESAWTRLVKLTRFFLDWRVDFDVQLSLLAEEVPEWRLSDEGPAASVLGLTTWLKTGKFDNDADDVILSGVPGKEAEAVRLARL